MDDVGFLVSAEMTTQGFDICHLPRLCNDVLTGSDDAANRQFALP